MIRLIELTGEILAPITICRFFYHYASMASLNDFSTTAVAVPGLTFSGADFEGFHFDGPASFEASS